jgi:hypothetical protein
VTPFARAFGFVMLLGGRARAAGDDWPAPRQPDDTPSRASISLSQRAGVVAEAPFVTTAFPEVAGFGMVVIGAAAVQLSPIGWLGARLPVSYVRLDFPAGAQVTKTALGNLELGVEHRLELRAKGSIRLRAAFVAPTAEHGPETALLANRALAVGNALSGGKEAPLLTPGVTGLRLGLSAEHSHGPWWFRAGLDVPVLVRVSEGSLPEDAETHSTGVLPAIDLQAASWITSWLAVALGGRLMTEPLRVQEPARERDRQRRLQPVVEPSVHARLGRHVNLGLDGNVPAGGALGGEAWSIGLHGRLGF